jgi:dTDP-4-amino-4,6-dideoxygalactose transaminase
MAPGSSLKVPFVDLHAQYVRLKPEIDSAIQGVVDHSQFILGSSVSAFEQAFAAAHGSRHCIGVGSGTDALHLAIWAAGVGPGDLVLTTPFTFIATVEAISLAGATPVFVDIDPRTYNLDPERLEEFLSRKNVRGARTPRGKIKTIIPVHLYGCPAEMHAIRDLAEREGASVIEDACQAHLARYNGTPVGNFGSGGCFSFYPAKNLGAYGEAGAVTTNDDIVAAKIRQLRDHGQSEKYRHEFFGHNYRMDGIQGAVLGVKLNHLAGWTLRRREIAAIYRETLADLGEIVLPLEPPGAVHVYHLFVIRTKRRADLQRHLADRGIATALHYPVPLHLQAACKHLGYSKGDFPVSETAAGECIAIPLFPEMSSEQVEYVTRGVRSFFRPSQTSINGE